MTGPTGSTGDTGPTGNTGSTGATGSLTSDFAVIYANSPAPQTVNNGQSIVYNAITKQPVGSKIAWSGTNPTIITILDTGFYQVTFGLIFNQEELSGETNAEFDLLVNGGNPPPFDQMLNFLIPGTGLLDDLAYMQSLTTIVRSPASGTTLQVINNGGSPVTIGNGSTASDTTNPGGVMAYVTIVKLSN